MDSKGKSYIRNGAIIGAIIGIILMIVGISMEQTVLGVVLLVACFIIGLICGVVVSNSKKKSGESDEESEKKPDTINEKIKETEESSDKEDKPIENDSIQPEKQEKADKKVSNEAVKESKAKKKAEADKKLDGTTEKSNTETKTDKNAEEPKKEIKAEEVEEEPKKEVKAEEAEPKEEAKAEEAEEEPKEEVKVEEAEEELKEEDKAEEAEEEPKEEVKAEEAEPKEEAKAEETEEKPKEEGGFFSRLVAGLSKTRNSLNESFNNLFSGFSSIDDDFYDELEETLIMADLGLDTTENIIDNLKDIVKKNHIKDVSECKELVINIIKEQMLVEDEAYDFENQKTVMLIIGVNGVGKTTSIGKLAAQYKKRGKKVMMCAADTFRAAAIDQLKTWSNRAGVEIIAQDEGSDPAAVTFDAVKAAAARDVDILLVDTAGRLHNKKNLMDELGKMKRIIEKEYSDAHLETLIVLDGSTGQNALEQARQFSNVTQIDGIILTKLDGTAKGGIAIAIQSELNVPVKYIGVGEHIDDLQKFDPDAYVNALFADMDTRSDIEILIPED